MHHAIGDISIGTLESHDLNQIASNDGVIVLILPTFTATAEMAGISRVLGGYHIQADNIEGLRMGKKVAEYNYPRTKAYFDGTAIIMDAADPAAFAVASR